VWQTFAGRLHASSLEEARAGLVPTQLLPHLISPWLRHHATSAILFLSYMLDPESSALGTFGTLHPL
jgi:hypothetical protein